MAKGKHQYPRSKEIQNSNFDGPAFYTWNSEEERVAAVDKSAASLDAYSGFNREEKSVAADGRFMDFSNLLPGISSRPGLDSRAFDYFRPENASPKFHQSVIYRCNAVYEHIGLIKNIIDLMGDFACQGIRISNPDREAEIFGRNWFKIVKGEERSERFLNHLYRLGNVVVRKQNAKIPLKIKRQLSKAETAKADGPIPDGIFEGNENNFNLPEYDPQEVTEEKVVKRVIPWQYNLLDPGSVIVVGGSLASFVGEKTYAITIPDKVRREINNPKSDADKRIVEKLPKDILAAAKSKRPYLLPKDKVKVYHYKKDDWMAWANPMIYSILTDCTILDKLKLCDKAALDGAISNIRIFTIGNMEHKILPTPFAAAKLSSILQSNVGGGTMDIIWGPDLVLKESASQVYKFLGQEKYVPTLNAIYQGLGVPQTLVGAFGEGGTTNNFIALKTLTERLEYGRRQLNSFWDEELEIVRKAMGFKRPFVIEYDILNLADDDAIKSLCLSLVNMNLLSEETVLRMFKQNPEMEKIRNLREVKEMQAGKRVEKAGPFKEPVATESLKKIALQNGQVTPKQLGMDIGKPKDDDPNMLQLKQKHEMDKIKLVNKGRQQTPASGEGTGGDVGKGKNTKGKPGQGRPAGKKDTSKRATKKFTPRTKAAIEVWANTAQDTIAEILKPAILATYDKKNLRMLSNEQAEAAELLKFGVLNNMEPLTKVTAELVLAAIDIPIFSSAQYIRQEYFNEYTTLVDRKPTFDEIKQIQSVIYANLITETTYEESEGE